MTQASQSAPRSNTFAASAPSIDFFATCLAALADESVDPKSILESVICAMGVDKQTMLNEQAARYGYENQIDQFEQTLNAAINQQLFELKSCRLTSAERKQHQLIAAL